MISMNERLSSDAREICFDVLMRCNEFKNDRYLRTIFDVQDLCAYKNGLGEFNDPKERALGTIEYLHEKSSDGISLLIIFLEELKSINKDDPLLFRDLDRCIALIGNDPRKSSDDRYGVTDDRIPVDLNDEGSAPIRIPFVVAAMTQEESRELISGRAFDDPKSFINDREEFGEIRAILKTYEIENLEVRYGERREDWKPYLESEESIKSIIEEACKKINSMKKFDQVEPEFVSSDYFKNSQKRNQLKNSGVVLIMDDLSFFHPTLRTNLNKLISNDRAAIIMLSTLSGRSRDQPFYDLIDNAIKIRLEDAHERYCTNLDPKCEICVDDLLTFKRWLSKVLPEEAIFIRDKQPHPGSQKAFQAMYAEAYPTATAALVTGRPGRSGMGR